LLNCLFAVGSAKLPPTVRLGDVAAFENRQTEPKPNRITNDEDNYKSSIVKVKPGLKPNSEQKDEHIFVAPPYCQTASYVYNSIHLSMHLPLIF